MKFARQAIGVVLLATVGAAAHAYGLKYAVDSLQKAQALAKQGTGKHVLIFYTSPT